MNWKYDRPLWNVFSWAMLLFVLVGAFVLATWSKADIFWFLNHQHSYPGDFLLKYITRLGDGLLLIVAAIIVIALGKRKLGVLLILSFLLSGLMAQIIKRANPEPRPGAYFTQVDAIHKVDGTILMGRNSFPSGHTTSAFSFFAVLAFASRNYAIQFFYFLLAVSVAYSRIYLGQHFFKDVFAGAILGYACSLLLTWLFRNKELDA
jgi:membrane-associated phospholipid phosphatase